MQPGFHLLHLVSPLAAAAAASLIASVWEGALLVIAVWLCLRALPGLSAATRSVVWVGVLTLVIVLPWLSIGLASMHVAVSAPQHGEILRLGERWSLLLAAVWSAISALRLLQLARSAVRLRSLARHATPVQPAGSIHALLQGSSRPAELCASDEVDRPSVAGFFHPRILLPPELLHELNTAELEQVVLHELEHLRRRDDWTNLLQKLGLALLPLNPALLWIDRRLCVERELACDDGVLRATHARANARKAYAACLAGLAEHSIVRRGIVLALGIFGKRRSELESRVYRILGRPEAVMNRTQSRVATGFLLAGAAFAAFALASSPKLVSFGPGEYAPAARVQAAAEVGPQAIATAEGTAHTVLAKAVIASGATAPKNLQGQQQHISQPRLVQAVAVRQRKPVVIKAGYQHAAVGKPHLVLASWESSDWPSESTPRAVQAVTPHLVFAVDQDSQIRYAAVAVQGGWLIVQL